MYKQKEDLPVELENDKHHDLYAAIISIVSLNSRITDLMNRITGIEPADTEQPMAVRSNPSLVDVLNEGQFIIKDECDKAHENLKMIETLLFRR